jgi:hypothetical protein
MPDGSIGRIEVREIAERPRLTLVSRDGDPSPAIVAAVGTDAGAAGSTALAALVEARLRAAGFAVDTLADQSALRVRWSAPEVTRLAPFFEALSASFHAPVAEGTPELALAAERLRALRRHPLDAPELAPVAACTGRLGIAAADPALEPSTPQGARALEALRRGALDAGHTSVAVVGPSSFCLTAARALEDSAGWERGAAPSDPWPVADALAVYPSPRATLRIDLALRVPDPHAAVAAADRLGAESSPLVARLDALRVPFRAVEVVGAARPRGGCVGVTLEARGHVDADGAARAAAIAAAVARKEARIALSRGGDPTLAARQVLSAEEAVEAASRAAWWALAGPAGAAPERSAIAVGLPASRDRRGALPVERAREEVARELERPEGAVAIERRVSVERGQGELWLLLASPCGPDEGGLEAGTAALAAMAAAASSVSADVTVEPWISADGVGVLAHGGPRSPLEPAALVAERVGDAAGRAIAAAPLTAESLALARASLVDHLERTRGSAPQALEAFLTALRPERPSELDPFGLARRVAAAGAEPIRARLRALAASPLRLAILANADVAQASAAAAHVDRWLSPRPAEVGACGAASAAPPHHRRAEVRFPGGDRLGRAMIGALVPPRGAPDHDLAELAALALDGDGGLLASALPPATRGSARVLGGPRSAALLVEIDGPEESIGAAITATKTLLERLGREPAEATALARAASRAAALEREAAKTPRRRLVALWTGRVPSPVAPAPDRLRAFFASALRDDELVVVEARPE